MLQKKRKIQWPPGMTGRDGGDRAGPENKKNFKNNFKTWFAGPVDPLPPVGGYPGLDRVFWPVLTCGGYVPWHVLGWPTRAASCLCLLACAAACLAACLVLACLLVPWCLVLCPRPWPVLCCAVVCCGMLWYAAMPGPGLCCYAVVYWAMY